MAYKNSADAKANAHKWYLNNTDRHKVQAKASRDRIKGPRKIWIQEIKSKLKCLRGGESRWYCLAFHHRDPNEKDFDVSRMCLYSKKRILEEIAKCDCLCHNCHAEVHYNGGLPESGNGPVC